MSVRPISSFTVRMPNFAMIDLTSSAMKNIRLITCSGFPLNFFLNSLSWVAIPTGQVFKWHFLIIIQPDAIKDAVAIPNSSAPSIAAIATSLPVLMPPSVWTQIRPLSLFKTNVW